MSEPLTATVDGRVWTQTEPNVWQSPYPKVRGVLTDYGYGHHGYALTALAGAQARIAALEEELRVTRLVARDAARAWNSDNDTKVRVATTGVSGGPSHIAATHYAVEVERDALASAHDSDDHHELPCPHTSDYSAPDGRRLCDDCMAVTKPAPDTPAEDAAALESPSVRKEGPSSAA